LQTPVRFSRVFLLLPPTCQLVQTKVCLAKSFDSDDLKSSQLKR
jgi:hypothetical protein